MLDDAVGTGYVVTLYIYYYSWGMILRIIRLGGGKRRPENNREATYTAGTLLGNTNTEYYAAV